jgi:hypothetical protein
MYKMAGKQDEAEFDRNGNGGNNENNKSTRTV